VLRIIRIALERPYTFIVLAVVILIFGTLSAIRTPTDIFPNIGIPVVSVVWTYTGMTPRDMSGYVVYYYERTLTSQVNNIEHLESQSLPGYGVVKIFFQPDVDINAALAQVTAASQTVLKQLPPAITPPDVLVFNASSVPILQLTLSSKSIHQMQLFDDGQNFIRPQLATVAGAAVPSPYGGKVLQVQVDIDQHALQANGLSATDVVNAIAKQNLVLPAGTEKIGKFEWVVELNASPQHIAELNDLPVKEVNGTVVYVRDVAYVHAGSPPQTNLVRVNGTNAVLMTVLKSGSASTLDVIDGVRERLPLLKQSLPAALHLAAVSDQSVFVKSAVISVVREGVIAAVLSGLMILLFLGSWRSTLIISASIPLAILFSLTMLSNIGETINTMTLGGLALAVGILVDDATVTIENINYHLEQGKDIKTAILDGSQQIVLPAFVILTCLCIVFVPMFQLGGVAHYLFVPLAEAVVFALIGSFILSRTLVPTLANYLLRRQRTHGAEHEPEDPDGPPRPRNPLARFQRGFEQRFEAFRLGYRSVLELALRRCRIFIAGVIVFVLASFALAPWLGENFFPSVDGGQILMHVRAQPGTRIEETARLCDEVETAVRKVIPPAELGNIVDNIGLPVSGISMAYNNTGTIGPEDADVLISLNENHRPTAAYVAELRRRLPRQFPGATFAFLPADITTQVVNFGLPAPIDLQVIGPNQEDDYRYAQTLLRELLHVSGLVDLRIQQVYNYPAINIDVSRTLAQQVGLTQKEVASNLLTELAGSGQTNPSFWLNPKNGVSYPVVVQTPQYRIDTMSDLENLPVTGPHSTQLLGALSTISRKPTEGVVSHYAVQPVVDIFASVQGRDLGAVSSDIRTVMSRLHGDLPRGSQAVLRGQVATMNTAYNQLFFGLFGAIVLIYLVIVVNFHSWTDPLVVITALPAALAGIIWMLFASFTTLSVPALTGAIMSMGVATSNSILVVSFARERLAFGDDPVTAALQAGFTRFRPVLMTALAMIIGMAPMALGTDQNAPLGRAVIGGLLFATCNTLLLVPVVFSLVHGRENQRAEPQHVAPAGTG
jgi:multidrug efflux pump subunit AcrB